MRTRRSFLFLQGNASWFYRKLGAALAQSGQGVARINVCGGDRAYWGDWQATDWPGGVDGFDRFMGDECQRRGITDLVLFGDCRPLHRIAIGEARRRGIEIHVFEEGYMRPDWVTLERQGVNGYSRLPSDPDWYRNTAREQPSLCTQPVGAALQRRILYDVWWQASNYLQLWRYPRFRTHRPAPIWAEYATWAARLTTLEWRLAQALALIADLLRERRRFFFFPLQLDSDYQIRVHSALGRMHRIVEAVIDDFAAHAPTDCRLVLKNHPLDNGWINFRRRVGRQARARSVADRVLFIDGGDLGTLIEHCRGVVTVNSTVGLAALAEGKPVICLGTAIYDICGMTHQGPLAGFWGEPDRPDPTLVSAYQTVVGTTCLVNGSFYTDRGLPLAVTNSVRRLLDPRDVLSKAPPRRATPVRLASEDVAA